MRTFDCSSAQKLMSPFIDSMITAAEAEHLDFHVAMCQPCRRQLQSYKSMRSLLARVEKPVVPDDMVLDTRVRLSQGRNKNFFVRLENRLSCVLKPIVVPAVFGVSLTMLFLGILLGSFASDAKLPSNIPKNNIVNETPNTAGTTIGFNTQLRRFSSRTKKFLLRPCDSLTRVSRTMSSGTTGFSTRASKLRIDL